MKKRLPLLLSIGFILSTGCSKQPKYMNSRLTAETRAEDLVSRMTLEEKVSQMGHLAPAIERLGVIEYGPIYENLPVKLTDEQKAKQEELLEKRPWENLKYWEEVCMIGGWWNEALHGIAQSEVKSTSFPQSIGLGSTWNPDLIKKMANKIGDEARVHNNIYGKKLSYWSPNINVLRDPRWGRTEESYSEDPFLLSRMAVAFVKGLQGDHPKYLKAVATVKHFAANNSEFNRHKGSSDVEESSHEIQITEIQVEGNTWYVID